MVLHQAMACLPTVGHSVTTTTDQYVTTTTSRRGFVANSLENFSPTSFSGVMGGATITNLFHFWFNHSDRSDITISKVSCVGAPIPLIVHLQA